MSKMDNVANWLPDVKVLLCRALYGLLTLVLFSYAQPVFMAEQTTLKYQ